MKKTIFSQYGRSMVEMLGVLAIIGVLSVGAISGYSKAMEKYKINKTLSQISMIVSSMRTTFINEQFYSNSIQPYDYSAISTEKFLKLGIISEDMVSSTPVIGEVDSTGTYVVNLFKGGIWIFPDDNYEYYNGRKKNFILSYNRLPKNACIALATQDWNLLGVSVMLINFNEADLLGYSTNCNEGDIGDICYVDGEIVTCSACPEGKKVPIPMPLTMATEACSNCYSTGCIMGWVFPD